MLWEIFHNNLLESNHGYTAGWASSRVLIELRKSCQEEDLQLPLGQGVERAVGLTLCDLPHPSGLQLPSCKVQIISVCT